MVEDRFHAHIISNKYEHGLVILMLIFCKEQEKFVHTVSDMKFQIGFSAEFTDAST